MRKDEEVKNLVICSTLNQITNYLVINYYKPERIFNITLNENADKKMSSNIKNAEWDKYIKEIYGDQYVKNDNFKDVELDESSFYDISKIKNKIDSEIIKKIGDESVYWHITGGQRIISLAIAKAIEERYKDKLLYIEGNTERLLILNNNCEYEYYVESSSYEDKELDIKKALRLYGIGVNEVKSTDRYMEIKEEEQEEFKKEHEFYQELYKEITENKTKVKMEGDSEDTFWNLLLKSNDKTDRRAYVQGLFKKLRETNSNSKMRNYNICESKEVKKEYPAGYIFEKVCAHKILDVINKEKVKKKIVEMFGSLKVNYTNRDDSIIDELDIVLLTSVGKVLNFECKSGGMKGDNAKSHNFTTYRLSGVFGTPVFLSPLLKDYKSTFNKFKINENWFDKQEKALKAAGNAELEIIQIDEIKDKIIEMLKEE